MGLSNEERYAGVVNNINALTKIAKSHNTYGDARQEEVKNLINDLWPVLLTGNVNQLFWFTGGAFESDIMGNASLVQVAFSNAFADIFKNDDSFFEPKKDSLAEYVSEYFHPSCEMLRYEKKFFYNCYTYSESFFYYANRYKGDGFSNSLKEVSKIYAKIQGICFEEFSSNPLYLRYWMIKHIIKKIMPLGIPDDDKFGLFARENSLHHKLTLREDIVSIKSLTKMFNYCRKRYSSDIPIHIRAEIFIRLCDITFINTFKSFTSELGITRKQADKINNLITVKYNKHKKNKKEKYSSSYHYCWVTGETIKR